MAAPPLYSPSNLDLSVEGNVIQAQHELHRAQGSGTDAALADWVRKWGDATITLAFDAKGRRAKSWNAL